MERTFRAPDVDSLTEVVAFLSGELKAGDVVCFIGEMGAGKTTLIGKLLRSWGITAPVDSPTFALVNEFVRGDGVPLYHFDFYRLNNVTEALQIGLEDYLGTNAICLMEWPQMVMDWLPEERWVVRIQEQNGEREIKVERSRSEAY
ncbi:MAG: tRNA (adenosine(37)-N6)-threonylcarbamoyltransferase complex ATPase subunit type 1 TsaE [Cryomorphaceae bacterium]|nr:MAG: tRNA (adenosine(37)-N6)-threonylcarbamoyltransferase complex ATPase subunit type 1 TsaE [Cryomorphaceae bacterium]